MTDAAYLRPPAGSLAGSPNSGLEDPVASRLLPGCAPHKCSLDDIESYSTNEVAINWNSALVWTAAWLSDHAHGPRSRQDLEGLPAVLG